MLHLFFVFIIISKENGTGEARTHKDGEEHLNLPGVLEQDSFLWQDHLSVGCIKIQEARGDLAYHLELKYNILVV